MNKPTTQADQRLYDVYRLNDQRGTRVKLNATPMTPREACTFNSKCQPPTYYPQLRNLLVEVKPTI